MDIEQAKEVLRNAGYYVDALWNIRDVTDNFEVSDDDARGILERALNSEWVMEQTWYTIKDETTEV
jgi:hypothetical protein